MPLKKSETGKPKLKRNTRGKPAAKMVITERDVELVRATLKQRFLYTYQYYWLFPEANQANLRMRLILLFKHGYLNRIEMPVSSINDPIIYGMTEKGAQLLAQHDGVDREAVKWKRHLNVVKPTHLQHLLAINDCLVSFRHGLTTAKATGQIADFRLYRGDPKRFKLSVATRDAAGHRMESFVVPDAILVVQSPAGETGTFFLEIDRGTLTTGRWQEKVLAYREYAQDRN